MAHLQLAEEADGEHLNAGDDQHRANYKHGSMVVHQVQLRVDKLHSHQECSHEDASHDTHQAEAAEAVKRPAPVPVQEANSQEVKKDAKGAADAVMALSPLAVDVADGNLGDGRSIPAGECGNEAVHLAVERNAVD